MVGSRKLELHMKKKSLDLLCNAFFSLSKNYNYFDKSDIISSLDDRIKNSTSMKNTKLNGISVYKRREAIQTVILLDRKMKYSQPCKFR